MLFRPLKNTKQPQKQRKKTPSSLKSKENRFSNQEKLFVDFATGLIFSLLTIEIRETPRDADFLKTTPHSPQKYLPLHSHRKREGLKNHKFQQNHARFTGVISYIRKTSKEKESKYES